jgi:hypothetical protein
VLAAMLTLTFSAVDEKKIRKRERKLINGIQVLHKISSSKTVSSPSSN